MIGTRVVDERRISSPSRACDRSGCEIGRERVLLINERETTSALHHQLDVSRRRRKARRFRPNPDLGEHLH